MNAGIATALCPILGAAICPILGAALDDHKLDAEGNHICLIMDSTYMCSVPCLEESYVTLGTRFLTHIIQRIELDGNYCHFHRIGLIMKIFVSLVRSHVAMEFMASGARLLDWLVQAAKLTFTYPLTERDNMYRVDAIWIISVLALVDDARVV